MVTHEARAAAIADRVLFLADGLIVRDMRAHDAARRPRGDGGARRSVIRVALKGLAGRNSRTSPDRARDRARRRDDERRLRPHGHDRQGVRRDLRRLVRRHRRGRHRQGDRHQLRGRVGEAPPIPEESPRARARRRRRRGRHRLGAGLPDEAPRRRTARRSTGGSRPTLRASASTPRPSTSASTRSTSSRAAGRRAAARSSSTRASPTTRTRVGDRIGVAAVGPAQQFRDRRDRQVRRRRARSAARPSRSSTCRRRRGCSARRASSTRSRSRPKRRRRRRS